MISHIVTSGFDMIFSNADALYLDCGYGAWVGSEGQNWCSPYKGLKVIWNCSLTGGYTQINYFVILLDKLMYFYNAIF